MRKYNWGVLGTGNIARKFCHSLHLLENAVLYAVGSRDQERADDFARDFNMHHAYGSYEDLVSDSSVDIIYIATPHTYHLENTLLCLRHGKHVICEKPLSINAKEVRQMTDEARVRGLLFMEALWPPFQPSYIKAREIIESGEAGKVLHMRGKFGFNTEYDPEKRTYNLGLGGGAVLDIGIYPVMDILQFMGVPDDVEAWSDISPTGADRSTAMMFRFNDGRMAEAYCSFNVPTGISTEINCENCNIILERSREMGQKLYVDFHGREPEVMMFTPSGMGYQFEAAEVMRCLDKGLTESQVVPHSFSHNLIEVLDLVRSRAGIIYPGHD